MQGVTYLAARGRSPERIAVLGYLDRNSLSPASPVRSAHPHSAPSCSAAAVPAAPAVTYSGNLPCQGPPYRALLGLGDRPAILYALNAQRGPMYIMNGTVDTTMASPRTTSSLGSMSIKQRTLAVLGPSNPANKNLFTAIPLRRRPSPIVENRDAALWLNDHILRTDASASYPPPKVSAESTKNGVTAGTSEMRPDHEGGIDALDLNHTPRADLMVLPETDRQKIDEGPSPPTRPGPPKPPPPKPPWPPPAPDTASHCIARE